MCVKNSLNKDHLTVKDRFIWSAFCYMNGVPFGLMVSYAVKTKRLRDDNAVDDILNSWTPDRKIKMERMDNLLTYDRYCLTHTRR